MWHPSPNLNVKLTPTVTRHMHPHSTYILEELRGMTKYRKGLQRNIMD